LELSYFKPNKQLELFHSSLKKIREENKEFKKPAIKSGKL
jgi:hypothetical protein